MPSKSHFATSQLKKTRRHDFYSTVFRYVLPGTETATWNRGIIRKVNDKTADVVYVDYGTLDEVLLCDIRLDITLEDVPIQTQRCVLHNIMPVDGAADWPVETLNYIHKLVVDKEFKAVVKAQRQATHVSLEGELKIEKHLVLQGMAVIMEKKAKAKDKSKKKFHKKKYSEKSENK